MKTLLLALLVIPSLGHAAIDEQVFCGEGKDSGTISGSQIAFVLKDGRSSLYFEGKDVSSTYAFSQTSEGSLATANDSKGPSILFGRCSQNVAGAHFVGGEVSNQPFLCNCL